jgi:hypothetical protein
MEMEYMIARLLAELKTTLEHLKEEMRTKEEKTDTNLREMTSEMRACQEAEEPVRKVRRVRSDV